MTAVWTLLTLWAGLALIAGLLSAWLRVSTALTEIIVGTAAQAVLGALFGAAVLGSDEGWIKFFAGIGAIMLTFLAGAELAVRRHPALPRRYVSADRYGFAVGDVRRLLSGEAVPESARRVRYQLKRNAP